MLQLKLVSLSPSCSIAFLVILQGPSTCLSFCFPRFPHCVPPGRLSPPFVRFPFSYQLSIGPVFESGLCDLFKFQNLREFSRLILQDRFLSVHIPFSSIVKFQFHAQFPLDHLSHPLVSRFVMLLFSFAILAYHVINCFILFTTKQHLSSFAFI